MKIFRKLTVVLLMGASLPSHAESLRLQYLDHFFKLHKATQDLSQPVWLTSQNFRAAHVDGISGLKVKDKIVKPQLSEEFQAVLDAGLELLLSTPYGLELCARVFASDADNLELYLGVSERASQQIANRCSQVAEESVKDQVTYGSKPRDLAHAFSLLIFVDEIETVDGLSLGMTTSQSHTHFSRLNGVGDAIEFLSILAHEVAVNFDGKSFPRKNFFKAQKISEPIEKLAVVANPEINYALAALRALNVEKTWFQELGLKAVQSFGDGMTCGQQVKSLVEHFKPYHRTIWKIFGIGYDFEYPGFQPRRENESLKDYINRRTIEALALVETYRVEVNGRQMSLCEYFTQPMLSGTGIRATFGPRPRIKNWIVFEEVIEEEIKIDELFSGK